MRTSSSLQSRFLAALVAGGALGGLGLGACGGAVDSVDDNHPSGAGAGTSSSSSSSSGGVKPAPTTTTTGTSSGYNPPVKADASTPVKDAAAKDVSTIDAKGLCSWGQPTQACYTHVQLEYQWNNPSRGGDVAFDAGPAPWDPDGCLPAADVQDGCCNPAISGPIFNGTQCCYVHCTGGCCGRPFMVDGKARVAVVIERDGWISEPARPDEKAGGIDLDTFTRERIATAWSNDAAMEHASIAAFARFTLELLALGAPADLLLGAQAATRDEIEHARACFAIASGYARRSLGPSSLQVSGAIPTTTCTLIEVATAAAVEGCVGETLSAILAEARAARCEDPKTRAALETISADEASHAELAWRFIGWAIAVGGEDVRVAVATAIADAQAHPPVAFDETLRSIPAPLLRRHGLLDEQSARSLVSVALRDVVRPCVDAMALQAA